MNKGSQPEIYAKFRLSIWNEFRSEYSYVDYRRWGVVELWAGSRIRWKPERSRQRPEDCIEVWFNWEKVGEYKSYAEVEKQLRAHLRLSPVHLGELLEYLDLR